MRITAVLLLMLSSSMIVTNAFGAQARPGNKIRTAQTHAKGKRSSGAVIEFGHLGGNLRPYRIAIDADGRVRALEGAPPLKTDRIPAQKVRELADKAADKSLGDAGTATASADRYRVLPDFGYVFVKVRRAGGQPRLIRYRGPQTGPLGEFYQVLTDLVLAQP